MRNYELDFSLSKNKQPLAERALLSAEAVRNDDELRNSEFALREDALIQKAIGVVDPAKALNGNIGEKLGLALWHSFSIDGGFIRPIRRMARRKRVFALFWVCCWPVRGLHFLFGFAAKPLRVCAGADGTLLPFRKRRRKGLQRGWYKLRKGCGCW